MRDVIVIGAGPSGSHAARRCAQLGLDVVVFDRAAFPREKPCGGVVGERTFDLIGREAVAAMDVVGKGGDVYYDGILLGRSTHPEYYCRRRTFDHYLLERALEAGAGFRARTRVRTLEVSDSGVRVCTSGGDFEARIVVGADGVNSVAARGAGLSTLGEDSRYAALRAEVPVTAAKARELGVTDPPRQATHFFPDLFGFAWVVPLRGAVNVGMGATVDKAAGLRGRFSEFLAQLGLESRNIGGAQIPYLPPPRVWAPRLLLTGDAGGFVDPWTGCGIEAGILASERAAQVCHEAVERDDFSSAQMARYGALTRGQLDGIRRRGQWIKFADRMVSPGQRFPFWVEFVLRNLVGLDSAAPELQRLGRRLTAGAARKRGAHKGFQQPS